MMYLFGKHTGLLQISNHNITFYFFIVAFLQFGPQFLEVIRSRFCGVWTSTSSSRGAHLVFSVLSVSLIFMQFLLFATLLVLHHTADLF